MTNESELEKSLEFAENPDPRCACTLLLDTSGSMNGAKIDALNEGLQIFKNELIQDDLASRRVEVAIVTFDSQINVIQDFVTADAFEPPRLTAQGQTFMGTGIKKALDMVNERKKLYRENGVAYFRPWVFMITDGQPEGEAGYIIEQASQRVKDDEEKKRVAFFAVGVEGANMDRLRSITAQDRPPVKLDGLKFRDMFVWLSKSMEVTSRSNPDDKQIALPAPGWTNVSQ